VRGLRLDRPHTASLVDLEPPVAGDGWAVIAPHLVALCGSDVRLLDGAIHDASYPLVPGHEWTGVVLEAPGNEHLEGERVVGDNLVPCGRCDACASGASNLCAHLDEVGFTLQGACSDRFVLPAANLLRVPDAVSAQAACLAEPLAVAVHGVDRAEVQAGDTVAVFGGGAIGLLVAQVARAYGAARVSVIDPRADRRAAARDLGFEAFCPDGADAEALRRLAPDVVVEASGEPAAFCSAVDAVRARGRVCQLGYGSMARVEFSPTLLMLKELHVCGSLSAHRSWDRAVELLASGDVETECLVTHVFAFDDWAQAFATLRDPACGAIRVALEVA
jgi:2-desacetyl-2-hydroxyethyl bacteriochlorophyllide A dehydrogenase